MSCLHICYLCHFWVFVHWSYFYELYVMFSISCFVSFDEIYAKLYTWNASTSIIHNCGIFSSCISLYKFHFPSREFTSVSAYLFLLSWQCWYVHNHMIVKSTDDIIQCLCMDIYSHLQTDHFWELCLIMIQFIWVSYKT